MDTESIEQEQEEDSKTFGNSPESVHVDEEYNWQEEELFVEMGKQLDRERRQEEVAKEYRCFWAEELLLKSMWDRLNTSLGKS